jgi:hypothetical protein
MTIHHTWENANVFILNNPAGIRTYILSIGMLVAIGGCGPGGDSEVKTDDRPAASTSTDEPQTIHMVLQARSTDDGTSGPSNRISTTASPGDTATLTWTDPTRTVGDECLAQTDIQSYSLRYGAGEDEYSANKEISKIDDRALICQPSASLDGECGSVYHCEYTFEISRDVTV